MWCGQDRYCSYQHFNVKPDIITLAKGVANGLPLGVVCAVDEVAQAFVPGDHGSTLKSSQL